MVFTPASAAAFRQLTRHQEFSQLGFLEKGETGDSLVPLVELYGQTDDFVLRYVERLHHFPWFQHTILRVEVPPPLHLI